MEPMILVPLSLVADAMRLIHAAAHPHATHDQVAAVLAALAACEAADRPTEEIE